MRVFELAKKMRVSSSELLQQADTLDLEVYSTFTELEDEAVSQLTKVFEQRSDADLEEARAAKLKERQAKIVIESSRRDADSKAMAAMLQANRSRALEMHALAHGEPVGEGRDESGAPPEATVAQPPVAPPPPEAKPVPEPPLPVVTKAPVEKPKVKPSVQTAAKSVVTAGKTKPASTLAPRKPRASGGVARGVEQGKPPRSKGGKETLRPGVRVVLSETQPVDPERVITLRGAVVVKELAEKLGVRPNRLIADLMQINILASINQRLELDLAQKIADKYGFKVEQERQKRSTERKLVMRSEDADDAIPDDPLETRVPRPPIVTFLGHVDHGKTSLMDKIRHARVASGEAGGITQHIGSYTIDVNGRKITFLDTPGHAAFSAMRARGANLTDIAVIIIAADDGIMPQTREAIKHAQQAGVQIMVAINKCDLPTAQPDRVRQMLQAEGLTPEEWGGDVICTEVSAVTGAGIDHLLEMILLQADVLELTANPNRRADGYVVEAQLEQGLGPTATVLVTGGTLKVGDIVLCGEYFGKMRGLIDDQGRRVKATAPGVAVKWMGLSGVPEAGAYFRVMLSDKRARDLAEKAAEERKLLQLTTVKATSLDSLMNQIQSNLKLELTVIVKADTQGSSEAICEALKEIRSEKVSLHIISEAIGNISATDINQASAGRAIVVGFNVGAESGVQQLARHHGVRIATFRIIYELLEFVTQRMLDLLPPEYKEVVRGHAEVRAIFDIGKLGKVAGCQLLDGSLLAKGHFRVLRKNAILWQGGLTSLKHFQQEVGEITGSQECGIAFKDFEGFAEGDIVECFQLEELPRTL